MLHVIHPQELLPENSIFQYPARDMSKDGSAHITGMCKYRLNVASTINYACFIRWRSCMLLFY